MRSSSVPSGSRQSSSIVRSRSRTAEASSRSRLPPQVEHSTSPTRCSQLAAHGRREPRGFFQRRIQPLVLKAEQRPLRFSCACRRRTRRSNPRRCRATRCGAAWPPADRTARRAARRVVRRQRLEHPSERRSNSAVGHSPTAPWASVSLGSRNSAAGLAPVCVPNPSQAGHQPSELLNEKLCGVSRSKLRPQLSQAKCWLWISVRHFDSSHVRIGDRPRASRPCPATRRSPPCRRSGCERRREP